MKKIISLMIAVIMVVLSAMALTGCKDGKDTSKSGLLYKKISGDDFYTVYDFVLDKDEDGAYIDVEDGVIDIQEIVGKDVKIGAISENAFKGVLKVKKIIVPNTVNEIGAGAFAEMADLEELVVPFIGKNAEADSFYTETASSTTKSVCYARTMYYWFATNEMDEDACEISNDKIDGFSEITIKHSSQASETTFYMPVNFKSLTIKANKVDNENVYVIPSYACYGSFLENVNLENVKNVGDNSFGECDFLTKVNEETKANLRGQELVKSIFEN